jgi:hypothetical protein
MKARPRVWLGLSRVVNGGECALATSQRVSISPGSGSRHPSTYKNSPNGPVYAVKGIKPHSSTGDSGAERMSIATSAIAITVSRNLSSMIHWHTQLLLAALTIAIVWAEMAN